MQAELISWRGEDSRHASCVQPCHFRRTTTSHHAVPVAPNLLDLDFSAERPDEKGGADLSDLLAPLCDAVTQVVTRKTKTARGGGHYRTKPLKLLVSALGLEPRTY